MNFNEKKLKNLFIFVVDVKIRDVLSCHVKIASTLIYSSLTTWSIKYNISRIFHFLSFLRFNSIIVHNVITMICKYRVIITFVCNRLIIQLYIFLQFWIVQIFVNDCSIKWRFSKSKKQLTKLRSQIETISSFRRNYHNKI